MRTISAQILFPINTDPMYNGYIKVDDSGKIIEIGELTKETESTEFYNGVLVPGFVNSHCHIELSHLNGAFTQASGMAGFIRQINKLRLSVAESERRKFIHEQMEFLYNQGVSAMGDISNCNESFEEKSKSPLYTRTFLEVFGTEPSDSENIINEVSKLKKEADTYGIEAAPTPHSCYTMSRKLIKETLKLGLESGFISYHNQESSEEEELLISGTGPLAKEYKQRGLSTPEVTGKSSLLYFLDIISEIRKTPVNENILLIHNTNTNEESVKNALKKIENVFWVLCPLSNLFIHRELPPIELLRASGAKIALGTDSLSSNTVLSIVEEIKTIHKYFPTIPLQEILQWATINGAKALAKDKEFGSFEIGKSPGIVLIDNIDFKNLQLTEQSKSTRII